MKDHYDADQEKRDLENGARMTPEQEVADTGKLQQVEWSRLRYEQGRVGWSRQRIQLASTTGTLGRHARANSADPPSVFSGAPLRGASRCLLGALLPLARARRVALFPHRREHVVVHADDHGDEHDRVVEEM